ncbi:hypothetical protein EYF80_051709 [Liparis tanakae]|uniref:Uncharacterized protein n=1 Tax=Liparis tanakae TaxID=230148 RepID=A0A4Z2FAA9_9TELE|nr:hypothetical protein EYF80_051709 [Liparis tanakae]
MYIRGGGGGVGGGGGGGGGGGRMSSSERTPGLLTDPESSGCISRIDGAFLLDSRSRAPAGSSRSAHRSQLPARKLLVLIPTEVNARPLSFTSNFR